MGKHKHMGWTTGTLIISVMALAAPAMAQTFRAGPINLNVGITAGFTFTDNANNSEIEREADLEFLIGPTISGGITLPFSLRGGERLTLQTSFSYSYKISLLKDSSQTFGSPISASLVLPITLERWTIVAGDTFAFNNAPLETTWAFNRDKVTQYSNTASISATRQMGKAALTLATARTDKINPDDPDLEETTYQFSITPSYYLRENYSIFWRTSYSLNELASPSQRDSSGVSSEVGVSGQITPQLVGSVSIGYTWAFLEASGTNDAEVVEGVSSSVALSYAHPLRPNTTHSLSVFRSPGVTALLKDTAVTEITGLTYTLSHRLSKYITLAPNFTYSYLKAIGGASQEKTDLFSAGIGLGRTFTRHLSASVNYRFQLRSSNLENGSYYVNTVTASASYNF